MAFETEEPVSVSFVADTSSLRAALIDAERLAGGFGRAMTGALTGAVVRGKSLSEVLVGLGTRLSGLALNAALKPLETGLAGLAEGLFGKLFGGALPFAKGGVVSSGVTPFASGGVVASPTYFPMQNGRTGLMGEAGAEAIMPLARGPDGRLGVRGGGGGMANVTVNISTPDVESFRRSEAQVSASLARAVARGRRGM